MGGGRPILTFTSTLAIVGIGTTITNAKSNVPKNNFFILLPPIHITVLSPISLSCFPQPAARCRPRAATAEAFLNAFTVYNYFFV
jgi:hypothetical protein